MLAKEAISMAKIRLKNLSAIKDTEAMLSALNLAINDLYRRFNLKVSSETILVNTDLAVYTLRNDDVCMLLGLCDKHGREMRQGDVLNGVEYDYKILNYREFLLRHLFDGYVFAIYNASPIKLMDLEDVIEVPDAMIHAVITYIGYMFESIVTVWDRGQAKMETSFYWQLYEKECQELVNQGFRVPINLETAAIQTKGFR